MPDLVSQLVVAVIAVVASVSLIEAGVVWIDRAAHRADLDASGE
jgi:hypothetical protein